MSEKALKAETEPVNCVYKIYGVINSADFPTFDAFFEKVNKSFQEGIAEVLEAYETRFGEFPVY